MYRKRNGSLSFSFSRFMQNAVPNFASSWEPGSIYITPHRQDMMYAYQTGKPWPDVLDLDERSFYWAGVCDRERQSERIFIALLRNGVLTDRGPRQRRGSTADVTATAVEAGPTTNGSTADTPEQNAGPRTTVSATTTTTTTPLSMDIGGISLDTSKIGPKFIHQLAFISQTSQKNLINVLFFWEEEFHRLRKLASEEAELTTLINQAQQRLLSVSTTSAETHPHESQTPETPDDREGDADADADGRDERERKEELDQLRFARERVRMKERQRPSQRDPKIEANTDTVLARAFTLPDPTTQANALGGARRLVQQEQTPPGYWT